MKSPRPAQKKSKFFKTTAQHTLVAAITAQALLALPFGNTAYATLENTDHAKVLNSAGSNFGMTALPAGSIITTTHDLILNGRLIPQGSDLILDGEGKISLVGGQQEGLAAEEIIDTGASINDLGTMDYSILHQNDLTGQIEEDLMFDESYAMGRGRKGGRKSGVTNCYHVVKAIVRHRITLTGVAAYMAAPQLARAGWVRYADYNSAPMGSVCVFAAGGIRTPSGGHIYGHVGVKGAGGIANPTSGFHLQRPFLGCWNER